MSAYFRHPEHIHYSADCVHCLRGERHTDRQHNEAVKRSRQASVPSWNDYYANPSSYAGMDFDYHTDDYPESPEF